MFKKNNYLSPEIIEDYLFKTQLFSGVKILPFLVTLGRGIFCWPMVQALAQRRFLIFTMWVIIFIFLDFLDGALARLLNFSTSWGKYLDSFVDKTVYLIILAASYYYGILPHFLILIILGINIIQLFLTWVAVILKKRKKLPLTYLSGLSASVLLLSLFLKEPFSYLAYLLAVILSINHLYYYLKELFSKEFKRFKFKLIEKAQSVRKRIVEIKVIRTIFHYYSVKMERRKEIFESDAGIYTVANLITVGRIILIPLILYNYWLGETLIWIALLVIFLSSDFLDGSIARNLNQVSRWGKILDTVADKALFFAFLIVWLFEGILPAWLFGLLMIRIFLILLMASLVFFLTPKTLPIAFFSSASVVSLLFFLYGQSDFWLGLTVLLTWQLIVSYWYQGTVILLKSRKRRPLKKKIASVFWEILPPLP